ncbi:olefin beta-lactone synthetase [Shewanella sp. Isolate11]|uniref:olefin beta-lactone synthetase n=1 Tax=Shewanella sp. Isolate11 TaxID=2908530 RepID=UPI001EFDF439|nr:fatty acid CoA ligase family protein [Shewanella sp. Isolate11]MCG9696420.1 AMP-binding protein [Shewanella sp. Isolate11]
MSIEPVAVKSTAELSEEFSSGANLCRHLHQAAEQIPDQLAVAVQQAKGAFFSPKQLTYQEVNFKQLDVLSDRIAFALNQYGISRGMKAVLMVTPSIDFFALTFALFKTGVVPILVDPGMGIKNLKQCFIEAKPDAFIGIPKAHLARRLFGWGSESVNKKLTVAGSSLWGGASLTTLLDKVPTDKAYPMEMLDTDEMCAILFTSGSTGTPKGVVYSHKMFEAQITALKQDYGIAPGERDLATFPLFSLFGPALGMASIVPEMDASKPITANPEYIFAAVDRYQCSNMFVNPALIERLGEAASHKTDFKLASLKRVISAGAPATINSIKRFSQMLVPGVEVLNSYGATESLPISKIASGELFNTTDVTDNGGGICVGRAINGVQIAIIGITEKAIANWDDSLCLPTGEIGEIVVKGSMVSRRYYQRPSATAVAKINAADGHIYHRMGDLGYLDEQGLLWMCGRKAHRVDAELSADKAENHSVKRYFSIPCERIFNTHPQVQRSALVAIKVNGKVTPLVCLELKQGVSCGSSAQLYSELNTLAEKHTQTVGISRYLIHPNFPVDIRHNAKIFREKLAVWAQKQHKE